VGEKSLTKDGLINLALRFLRSPHPRYTRSPDEEVSGSLPAFSDVENSTRKKKDGKKSKSKVKEESEDDDDDNEEEEEEKKESEKESEEADDDGDNPTPPSKYVEHYHALRGLRRRCLPTDAMLRAWMRSYLGCFDLSRVTLGHMVTTAEARFGSDILKHRQRLRVILIEEL